jgi:hypothetical protein
MSWPLPAFALVVGVLGVTAVWVGLNMLLQTPVAWMGPIAALDMALMLRLAAAPPGRARASLAVCGTTIAIALGLWMVAATTMGRLLGLSPIESATRLGPVLAGELLRHGTNAWDITLLAISLPLAWKLAR